MKNYQSIHEGQQYAIHHPDGEVKWSTPKEYLAYRSAFNASHELCTVPSPGAGSRQIDNPGGAPLPRPHRPKSD